MSFNLENIIRANVKGLKPYFSARDEYVSDGSEMVFLDANENPFENSVNRYPDPQQRSLKAVLAKQRGIDVENILLGNGSDEVLDLLFRAFCEPKVDNIISLPPTYGMYKVLSSINAIENKEVLLTPDFQLDVTTILDAIDEHSKMLFICSPNNPTGNTISPKAIETLLSEFNGLIVIDEAYIDFSTAASWVNVLHAHPNLIVTQTLSKAYGLAGIRLGMCMASKEIIAILNKIKPPYNVNELTQRKAYSRVLDTKRIDFEIRTILSERRKLEVALEKIDFVVKMYKSEANFILARVDDADKLYQQLLEKNIVIRNRSTQPLCENTLRFTVGTTAENIKLIQALKEISNE